MEGEPFRSILDLAPGPEDVFEAAGRATPWGATYGGQLVAQALRAAAATVEEERVPHSLHASYLRPGDSGRPLELAVERVRDGGSFSTRAVTVRQLGHVLARVIAGFHVLESDEVMNGSAIPPVLGPETLSGRGWNDVYERRYAPSPGRGRTQVWMRFREVLEADPVTGACGLAYLADDIPDDAALALLAPERPSGADEALFTQSLDLSMWFHRPHAISGWLLHDFRASVVINACAMVLGEVFDAAGAHRATVAQQMLVRRVASRSTRPDVSERDDAAVG